ncbi:hypothetical protein OJAV_G00169930 [Oryzias javanicus]|uniref:Uncharacterized protein n=1 Tax=Oryzias javanicus TaxID=123683 RepID=A0A437CFK6_ORYJA|nr:hypothetical protein OJAV_G00169930 [Oryzias javanicus]
MKLNGDKPLSTSNARVSTKSKTYFFAGISDEPINTCEMNGVTEPKGDVVEGDKPTTKFPTRKVDPTVKPTKATVVPPVVRSEDVYPKRSRLNLYMLVMNGVRLPLTQKLWLQHRPDRQSTDLLTPPSGEPSHAHVIYYSFY